jgi:membrane protein implicated in regulation of membrane protease activity
MILDFIWELGPWAWIVAGLILLGLELLAPGSVFLWFGVAAILTGVVSFFGLVTWQIQLLIFVVLAVGLAVVGRRMFARETAPGDQPFLNDRAARLVGKTYVLEQPIVDGKGKIRIDESNWRVTGPNLPSGSKVMIAGADGAVLAVVKAEG